MTLAEAHIAFKMLLDKAASSAYPNFLPQEIDFYLNWAQDEFQKQRYGGNNYYRTAFEETQKRIDDLRTTVADSGTLATTVVEANKIYRVSLPSGYRFAIMMQAETEKTNCDSTWVPVRLVQHDDLSFLLVDPFNKPDFSYPLVAFEGPYIYIYADGTFQVNNFKLKYLKFPTRVDITALPAPIGFDFPEHTHSEIVAIAVNLVIENIESPRVATNDAKLNQVE